MDARPVNNIKEEIGLEVELLNQACLDLVAQIEQLKKENARLKAMQKREGGEEGGQDSRMTR
jgi:hypothetical protein